jgi:hypothetical protein
MGKAEYGYGEAYELLNLDSPRFSKTARANAK